MPSNPKIRATHLRRRACLYIRQSSLHQVETHKESQFRQYDMSHRAIALGWSMDQIDIIDEDQGKSGASAAQRTGFQDLRARVGAGEVGIVLSLEVSRLCRDNAEWHQLLPIAAISYTLIVDEYGVSDVSDLNDWMLLGLKGQLSEYELRGIRERMVGGQRSKAMRGELKLPLPIGLAYTSTDQVVLDPDQSITEAVDLVFCTFRRLKSAMQVTKWFRKQGLRLPSRPRSGNREICWSVLTNSQIQRMLHNPRYAGCYAYGRTKTQQRTDGSLKYSGLPMDQWMVCIPEAHPGYISLEEYQAISRILCERTRLASSRETGYHRRRKGRPCYNPGSFAGFVDTECASPIIMINDGLRRRSGIICARIIMFAAGCGPVRAWAGTYWAPRWATL